MPLGFDFLPLLSIWASWRFRYRFSSTCMYPLMCAGIHPVARVLWAEKKELIHMAWMTPLADLPPPKKHKFKHSLPKLESYDEENVPPEFWCSWGKVSLREGIAGNRSWISGEALRQAARARGVPVDASVEEVCLMLEQGAALGCVGRGRLPTQVKNSKQTLDHGDIICDVLQEWVKQGIAAGPLTWAEVQDYFGPDYTVNGMTTRPKPNGALRIIVDMSGPRDSDTFVPGWLWSPSLPGAVNTSIDPEKYPARMSSLKIFTRMLFEVGRGAVVCKIDWSAGVSQLCCQISLFCFNLYSGFLLTDFVGKSNS